MKAIPLRSNVHFGHLGLTDEWLSAENMFCMSATLLSTPVPVFMQAT